MDASTSTAADLCALRNRIMNEVRCRPGCGFMDLRRALEPVAVPGLVIRETHTLIDTGLLAYAGRQLSEAYP